MKASEKSLTFLRDQIIYIVPYFQRGYVWDENNWEGIWEELTANRDDCFLGSIILKAEEYSGREESCKTIIDGQQRLTTLTILLRALLDYYEEKGTDAETLLHFKELLFYRSTQWLESGSETVEVCKIEHSRLNVEDYTNVIEGKVDLKTIITDPAEGKVSSKILRCYKYFSDRLSSASFKDVGRIRNKLIVDKSKILVVIDLNNGENEQIIFDTINSTGVKLTASDIIKNAIFQNIKTTTSKRDALYSQYWQKQFEENDEVVESWLGTKGIGQNQRTYIDLFFYCFAIIKGFYNVASDKISDLATKYKEYIKNFTSDETTAFVKEICEYAQEYRDTFIGFDSLTSYRFTDDKNRLMQILETTKITAFDAFILYAVKNFNESKQAATFKNLERYVMRHYIIGNTTKMGSFTTDAAAMIQDNFDFNKELSDDLVSNVRLEDSLERINNNKAKLILFWVELHRHTDKSSDLYDTPLNYAYELEHVMPQAWQENWGLDVLPIKDAAGNDVPEEDAIRQRKEAVYQIGNMTLLTSRLNKKLQNYSFADKVNGALISRKQRDGMKKYASLSITKEVISVDPLVWDEAHIYKRTASLTKEIESIWPVEVAIATETQGN